MIKTSKVAMAAVAEPMTPPACAPLSSDILEGADKIANFLFGDPGQRRRVYWLAEKQSLPVFRLGQLICARKSTLQKWIEKQEQTGIGA